MKTYDLGSGDDGVCVLPLLGGVAFGELFVWFVCGCYVELTTLAGLFLFILFYFWLCASLMSFGHFVAA
jgi:hypothetical protein